MVLPRSRYGPTSLCQPFLTPLQLLGRSYVVRVVDPGLFLLTRVVVGGLFRSLGKVSCFFFMGGILFVSLSMGTCI